MGWRGRVLACTLLALVLELRAAGANQPRFIAFSLGEASRSTKAAQIGQRLKSLDGITRIGALVYDPESNDLILIGLAEPSLPEARWDDLVVAFRARIRFNEFPEVSIDLTKDTERTGRQKVNFVGRLADTPFGRDLLACDIFLKHYSLELEQLPQVPGVPSYRSLIEEAVRAEIGRQGARVLSFEWRPGNPGKGYAKMEPSNLRTYQARFWYKIRRPYVALCRPSENRPEVFRIDKVALLVDSQDVLGTETEANRKCRESFAAGWSERFQEMGNRCAPLRKLKILDHAALK